MWCVYVFAAHVNARVRVCEYARTRQRSRAIVMCNVCDCRIYPVTQILQSIYFMLFQLKFGMKGISFKDFVKLSIDVRSITIEPYHICEFYSKILHFT